MPGRQTGAIAMLTKRAFMKNSKAATLLVLGICAAGPAFATSPPAQATGPALSPLAAAVQAYNQLLSTHTPLTLAADDTPADPDKLPRWLNGLPLTQPEARAVVAAVGAYALDQHAYPAAASRHGVSSTLGCMALAVAAGGAQTRADRIPPSNTARTDAPYPGLTRATGDHHYASSPKWPTRHAHFTALLVDLDSCAGAYASALARLETANPQASFTQFAKTVREDMTPGQRMDATCSRAD